MRSTFRLLLVSAVLLLGATSISALEGRFTQPMYKNIARLDVCKFFGKQCGQAAADAYCGKQGYERATTFETENATPTRVYMDGQECNGPGCAAFKFIVCFTSAGKRGEGHGWPERID